MTDTLTLVLDGTVTLDDFAEAVQQFSALVTGLSTEVAQDTPIEWVVNDLQTSSAIATVRGFGAMEGVESVVVAYERVGEALQSGSLIPFSPRIQKPAHALVSLIDGKIESIRFESPRAESIIRKLPSGQFLVSPPSKIFEQTAYGAVEGIVESLSRRGGLRFTLYDTLHNKAVSCYWTRGTDTEERMRDAWGHRAIVYGRVRRDPLTGRALSVREISRVERVLEGQKGDWKRAIGAYPAPETLPETRIRAIRDAGTQ